MKGKGKGKLDPKTKKWRRDYKRLEPIADKIVRAGWAKGYMASDEKGIIFDWTGYGLERVKQLWEVADEIGLASFRLGTFWAVVVLTAIDHGWTEENADSLPEKCERKKTLNSLLPFAFHRGARLCVAAHARFERRGY